MTSDAHSADLGMASGQPAPFREDVNGAGLIGASVIDAKAAMPRPGPILNVARRKALDQQGGGKNQNEVLSW